MDLQLEILPPSQNKLLPSLEFLKKEWYLAGGTALALQIGHRESVDFDFFRANTFDTEKLFLEVQSIFPTSKKILEEKDTLYVDIDEVKFSFIRFDYPLIADLHDTPFLRIADMRDVAAMKLSAIQQRSTKKDYVDIYFILEYMTITELCTCYFEKFGTQTTESLLRKYLTYFEDIADVDLKMNKDISWEDIQLGIIQKATKL